jgi:hypothetical protein
MSQIVIQTLATFAPFCRWLLTRSISGLSLDLWPEPRSLA